MHARVPTICPRPWRGASLSAPLVRTCLSAPVLRTTEAQLVLRRDACVRACECAGARARVDTRGPRPSRHSAGSDTSANAHRVYRSGAQRNTGGVHACIHIREHAYPHTCTQRIDAGMHTWQYCIRTRPHTYRAYLQVYVLATRMHLYMGIGGRHTMHTSYMHTYEQMHVLGPPDCVIITHACTHAHMHMISACARFRSYSNV